MVLPVELRNKAKGCAIAAPPAVCGKDKEMLNSACPETVLQTLGERSFAAAKLGRGRS